MNFLFSSLNYILLLKSFSKAHLCDWSIFFSVNLWLNAIVLFSLLSIPGWMKLVYLLHCPSLAGCNWSIFFIVHPWLDAMGLFSSVSIPCWMYLVYFLLCQSLAGCNCCNWIGLFSTCPSLAGCNENALEFTCHRRLFDMILQDHRQLPVCIVRDSFDYVGSLKTRGLMNGSLELVSNYI